MSRARIYAWKAAIVAVAIIACATSLNAEAKPDMLKPIDAIATALTEGNATDAMQPFDRSFPKYDQLANYFAGLTAAFQLTNEVDVADSQDTGSEANLTLRWDLTLTDQNTNVARRRTGDIHVRMMLREGKWKIVDFSPINFFNPQLKTQLPKKGKRAG